MEGRDFVWLFKVKTIHGKVADFDLVQTVPDHGQWLKVAGALVKT